MTFRYRVVPLRSSSEEATPPASEDSEKFTNMVTTASASPARVVDGRLRSALRSAARKTSTPTRRLYCMVPASLVLGFIAAYTFSSNPSVQESLTDALAAATTGLRRDESSRGRLVMDRYLQAMNDPTEYHDSDFTFTPEIQKAIYMHQHPATCDDASFLIYYVYAGTVDSSPRVLFREPRVFTRW
jgi:hypothetical protein